MVAASTKSKGVKRSSGPLPREKWENLPDEILLDLRLCDLKLSLEGTLLERCIARVQRELSDKGLLFTPYFWISNDWYCPDGVTGVAVPFYMAHPRLCRLEQRQILEAEGAREAECMKILRHEVGHALENAYRTRRRRTRQQVFGKSTQPYPEHYAPKPYSKRFVLHLDSWYAQSHPDEDFAETFAVWLDPGSLWRTRYQGWPALKKLEFIDALMAELAGQTPAIRTRFTVDPVHRMKKTLRQHYRQKRRRFGLDHPDFYDRDLRRLFSDASEHQRNMTAASCLRKIRRDVRKIVAEWTGQYQYTIDSVIQDMIERSDELSLRVVHDLEQTKVDFTVLLTVQTMNYLHSGRHRVAL